MNSPKMQCECFSRIGKHLEDSARLKMRLIEFVLEDDLTIGSTPALYVRCEEIGNGKEHFARIVPTHCPFCGRRIIQEDCNDGGPVKDKEEKNG